MGLTEFTTQLSNCKLTRVDLDTEHHYFSGDQYFVSLTHILDIGAPFPEGLRQWLRLTSAEESQERLQMTTDRGTKLHHALESLSMGLELYLEDFPTNYEKDAIVTFIRVMRFLNPIDTKTELIVADPKLKVGGTLDLVGTADKRLLDILAKPLGKLKLVDDNFVLVKPLEGRRRMVRFVMDYKFTGRSTYNHKVQCSKYKAMYNESYAGKKARYSYIYRHSPQHKLHFQVLEADLTPASFNRIYATALEYLGKFPEPPLMTVYPDSVRLFDKVKEKKDAA